MKRLGMMAVWGAAVLALVCFGLVFAQRRPKTEPPKGPGSDIEVIERQIKKALRDYIAESVEEYDGFYPVQEPDSEETWNLKFRGPSDLPLRKADKDIYIIRARFSRRQSKVLQPAVVDVLVDFTFEWGANGWELIDEALYKAGKKTYFTYSVEHERAQTRGRSEEREEENAGTNRPTAETARDAKTRTAPEGRR